MTPASAALRVVDAPQQKDNLCGPFHAARILRDAGVTESDGQPLDQDLVALRAGTLLPLHEQGPQVPPGAVNSRDYRYELDRVDDEHTGTDAGALARAIEELSNGELACVPCAGGWDADTVVRLVDAAGELGARLIANVRTGRLWGSRPAFDVLLAQLDGHEVADPPAPDWDTGHFVELVQVVRGRGGGFILVRDSYPSLGWGGHHLQPPAAVAAALARGDGREGGVLAVLPSGDGAKMRGLALAFGLEPKPWTN